MSAISAATVPTVTLSSGEVAVVKEFTGVPDYFTENGKTYVQKYILYVESKEVVKNEVLPTKFGETLSSGGDDDAEEIDISKAGSTERRMKFVKDDKPPQAFEKTDKVNKRSLVTKSIEIEGVHYAVVPITANSDESYKLDINSTDTGFLAPLIKITDDKNFPKMLPRNRNAFKFGNVWFLHEDDGLLQHNGQLDTKKFQKQ